MKKTFLEKLLEYYNLSSDDYLYLTRDLTFDDIPSPYKFIGMKEAVDIVKESIAQDEKIVVYGDYDADGITSTSIIVKSFLYLGKKIGYYVPSRYIDGYGITLTRAKEIVEKGYQLVILVDNGICANESVQYLKDNGLKVIIIDHHESGAILPNADAIIHPQISSFSDIKTSAGFCSFMFSIALLERIDNYLLYLGAISVISDMMPLVGFNRDIVRLAGELYKKYPFYNIDLLKEDNNFDYVGIGIKIAPKINAIGRIIKTTAINHLVTYFTCEDNVQVFSMYKWIEDINERRKEMTKKFPLDISPSEEKENGLIKVYDIDEGINGIIANRIIQTYEKPTIVLTKDSNDDNILKGSMRARAPFNVVECLSALKDYLLTSGGHALAGGLSLKVENYQTFKEKYLKYCKETNFTTESKKDRSILLNLSEVTFENYQILMSLSPFGQQFEAPLFSIEKIRSGALSFTYNGKHIISKISTQSSIVGFNIDKAEFLSEPYRDLYGTLSLNKYKDSTTLQFVIDYYTKGNN